MTALNPARPDTAYVLKYVWRAPDGRERRYEKVVRAHDMDQARNLSNTPAGTPDAPKDGRLILVGICLAGYH